MPPSYKQILEDAPKDQKASKWNWLLLWIVWNPLSTLYTIWEGDGYLVLEVNERLSIFLYVAITSKHMPNVKVMAKAEAEAILRVSSSS